MADTLQPGERGNYVFERHEPGVIPLKSRKPEAEKEQQHHGSIKFRLTAFKDIKVNTTRRSYLVKGLLASTGLAVIWGPPKCYKSFWATDIGLHVALGWPYRDRRVVQTAVCYIALEGQYGFAARVEVFRKHHNISADTEVPFHLITTPLDLIREADRLIEEVKKQLGDKYPGLVFIDTLNRSLVGSESKDEDMAAYLRAAEKIEQAFNCAVATSIIAALMRHALADTRHRPARSRAKSR